MSNLFAYGTDNTPVGPTRLKFEDNDDNYAVVTNNTNTLNLIINEKKTNNNQFQSLSKSPSPTKKQQQPNLILPSNLDYSPTDRLCLKLNFK